MSTSYLTSSCLNCRQLLRRILQSQLRQRTPLQGEGLEGSAGFDSGAFATPKHRDSVASLQILLNLDLSRHFVGEKFVDHCKQVSDMNRFYVGIS